MKKAYAILSLALALLLPTWRLGAQSAPNLVPAETTINQYILRAAVNDVSSICANHGLTIVSVIHSNSRFTEVVVEGSPLADRAGLMLEVQADPAVVHFSFQRKVVSHEVKNGLPRGTTAALNMAAANYAAVPLSTTAYFYGQNVWQPYATQPGPLLLDPVSLNKPAIQRLQSGSTTYIYGKPPGTQAPVPLCQQISAGTADPAQNLGLGIVAIIDTGVDANNPVLKPCLVPGYDFTANAAGIPDEMRDPMLDQSTAAVLNQSTAHILNGQSTLLLNQSTAAVLNQSTAHILNGQNLPSAFGHGTMVGGPGAPDGAWCVDYADQGIRGGRHDKHLERCGRHLLCGRPRRIDNQHELWRDGRLCRGHAGDQLRHPQ
jgi:hypothetical protein